MKQLKDGGCNNNINCTVVAAAVAAVNETESAAFVATSIQIWLKLYNITLGSSSSDSGFRLN